MQKSHCDIYSTSHFHHSTKIHDCCNVACGAMATTSAEKIHNECVWMFMWICIRRKSRQNKMKKKNRTAHKNQSTKMHTHIYHGFGADSKSTFLCVFVCGMTVKWHASTLTTILSFTESNKSETKFQSKKFTTPHVWVFIYLLYGFFCFSFSIASHLKRGHLQVFFDLLLPLAIQKENAFSFAHQKTNEKTKKTEN